MSSALCSVNSGEQTEKQKGCFCKCAGVRVCLAVQYVHLCVCLCERNTAWADSECDRQIFVPMLRER